MSYPSIPFQEKSGIDVGWTDMIKTHVPVASKIQYRTAHSLHLTCNKLPKSFYIGTEFSRLSYILRLISICSNSRWIQVIWKVKNNTLYKCMKISTNKEKVILKISYFFIFWRLVDTFKFSYWALFLILSLSHTNT